MVVIGALRPSQTFAVLGVIGLGLLGCGAVSRHSGTDEGAGGSSQTGGGANTGAGTAAGGGAPAVDPSGEGAKLRLLTQSEYTNALTELLGRIDTTLELPEDIYVGGFVSIGASYVTVNASAVSLYEAASRAATAEVFADAERWHELVGCEPADWSEACVGDFIHAFGRRAYRRDLTDAEKERWLEVGSRAASLPGAGIAQGLSTVTYGLLNSMNFLYRVETNELDPVSGRLRFDGSSMATRLAFLLTGAPPTDALLAAAAAGELDSAEGLQKAAAPLFNHPRAADRMAEFFTELSQARLVSVVQKSPELFPSFDAALRASMIEATENFIKHVVLAPGADVRSFYDSDQTFVDATLAPLYGVSAPASGFVQLQLGPETGRAGILGQAAVLASHAQPDYTSPPRRGVFILQSLLCITTPPPPDGVITTLPPDDPNLTTRRRLERTIAASPTCAECHATFDDLGFALEHFDAIGQYRATEKGQPIDATGKLDGVSFDGVAELGAVLRADPRAVDCMLRNFYRNANGRVDTESDAEQIGAMSQTLTRRDYVWRDLVSEFIVSDAFRSAPVAVDERSK